MLLLQIEPVVDQAFASRVADQLFSIVLLVAYALYSNRKQAKTDAKIDQYMQNDRAKMMDVIASNTRAFENLTLKIGNKSLLLIAVGFTFFISSCGMFRKTIKTESVSRDSVSQFAMYSELCYADETTEIRDTILNIAARSVTGIIQAPDLKPIYTLSGDTLPRSHTIQGKGVNVSLKVLPSGALEVTGNCDSIQQMVVGLIRENKTLKGSKDSLSQINKTLSDSKTEIEKGGWLNSVVTLICVMAISLAVGFFLAYMKQHK